VLVNGIAQAGSGSYLQASVIAVASLFGPIAVQAVMSGQAAVAVVVSGIQVLSATASVWGVSQVTSQSDGKEEEKSAFLFFGLSTIFLVMTAGAHAWLLTMPAYNAIVGASSRKTVIRLDNEESDERLGLVSVNKNVVLPDKDRIWRIAKANKTYEIAIGYVFVVTLVQYLMS
jgi:equilibrative nucleoside transporter 1/2/3